MIKRSMNGLRLNKMNSLKNYRLTRPIIQRNISSLTEYRRGKILQKIQKIVLARSSLFKLILIGGAVQLIYFGYSEFSDQTSSVILSIKDVLSREDLKDNDLLQMVEISINFSMELSSQVPLHTTLLLIHGL